MTPLNARNLSFILLGFVRFSMQVSLLARGAHDAVLVHWTPHVGLLAVL
jgi:hypothetical protein